MKGAATIVAAFGSASKLKARSFLGTASGRASWGRFFFKPPAWNRTASQLIAPGGLGLSDNDH